MPRRRLNQSELPGMSEYASQITAFASPASTNPWTFPDQMLLTNASASASIIVATTLETLERTSKADFSIPFEMPMNVRSRREYYMHL